MSAKLAIIGGGISGLSAARLAGEAGWQVHVFEKKKRPGGLVQCDWVDGNLFHKTGGHVFNARNKQVSDWFWKHFDQPTEFLKATRNAKILLHGKLVGYPLENNLHVLDQQTVESIISDFLELSKSGIRDVSDFPNFEEFLLGNFGRTLYNIYFNPYNRKIWNTDLSSVPLHWLEGKLPMPDIKKVLLDNILKRDESEMVHATFYYPRKGGSQFIVDRFSEGLNIHPNADVSSLKRINNQWEVNGQSFDSIIYTGDVRVLHTMISGVSNELVSMLQELDSLRSNGTSNVLCYTDATDLSWLYLPSPETKAHRIIYTGNFSEANNAPGGRRTCVVEFSGSVSEELMRTQIKALPGNLEAIAFNYEPNSYVIQGVDTRERIEHIKSLLAPVGFYLCGRFAEWEYYNMDKAIEASMSLVQKMS